MYHICGRRNCLRKKPQGRFLVPFKATRAQTKSTLRIDCNGNYISECWSRGRARCERQMFPAVRPSWPAVLQLIAPVRTHTDNCHITSAHMRHKNIDPTGRKKYHVNIFHMLGWSAAAKTPMGSIRWRRRGGGVILSRGVVFLVCGKFSGVRCSLVNTFRHVGRHARAGSALGLVSIWPYSHTWIVMQRCGPIGSGLALCTTCARI